MDEKVTNGKIYHELGAMEARLDALEKQAEKVDEIHEFVLEAKGGKRMFIWALGIAATIGGFVSWALEHIVIR